MRIERMNAEALLEAFDPPLRPDTLLRMEVNLSLTPREKDSGVSVALRIGTERLYVVRQLPAFLAAYAAGQQVSFGKGFVYDPESMCFAPADGRILDVLLETEEARGMSGDPAQERVGGKFMALGSRAAVRLLRLLMGRPFRLAVDGAMRDCEPIARQTLEIRSSLTEQEGTLNLSVRLPSGLQPVTEDFEFVWAEGGIVSTVRSQRRLLRALRPYAQEEDTASFGFAPRESGRVVGEVLPYLELGSRVEVQRSLEERIVREDLRSRIYIDREGRQILARVAFDYGGTVIDPFAPGSGQPAGGKLLVRNAEGELAVLEMLAGAGFHVSAGRIHLVENRKVLQFVLEGADRLRTVAEVYASEDFKKIAPRRPQLTGRLSMADGSLHFTLFEDGTPVEELAEIMKALRERKRYFRLKDGAFLDLSGQEEWEELAETLSDADELHSAAADRAASAVQLQNFRAAYLVNMLRLRKLPVEVDEATQETARQLAASGDPCPQSLSDVLRPYQERGFQWIQALYRLNMGGVLADDMGLGKTLQVIAAMVWARDKEGRALSLVVAPTSLVYNWQAEFQRFAPQMKVEVLEGAQNTRQVLWERLAGEAEPETDVLIVSYPLLRRDAEAAERLGFRFVVLDEAQHIKNPRSLAAEAADRMHGRIRLALTGTPMENNPGELWSIFHFVLPGYLAPLGQFMRQYGDGSRADVLARKIRPFLLRRLKTDVLPELPDKIEHRVLADMPDEQRKVYAASAAALRERVERVLGEKGIQRGRMEVLSAITQLRQICCHPQLALREYQGSSGKMDALLEILPDVLSEGRRVLLFSQFTSMLAILRRRLDAEGVPSMYLDGKTPVSSRLELVNRFNAGEGQVFLISLKAGGAGLNLTGADTVVHYDPWWNPAAEDQATDRAHRIGQRHVVHVIRLITRGTIEEQVARLSERKRALFDAVVTAGEQLPANMTEEEILELFG